MQVLILLWQFCALLLNVCKESVCCKDPRRSESTCRLKRTPLPVLASTRIQDKNKCPCAENLVEAKAGTKRHMILTSECRALGNGAVTTYFNVLGLTWPTRVVLRLTTF
jgi:hypothetical protein